MVTSPAVCLVVRLLISSRFRKVLERASELDTAAATPSSISSVIQIRLVGTAFTLSTLPAMAWHR